MSIVRRIRSYLYRNSEYLQYLWLKREWGKYKKMAVDISDEEYAFDKYYHRTGRKLNLDAPKTYDDKL